MSGSLRRKPSLRWAYGDVIPAVISAATAKPSPPFLVRFPLYRLGRIDVSLFPSVAVVYSVCAVVRVGVGPGLSVGSLAVVALGGCAFPRAAVLVSRA